MNHKKIHKSKRSPILNRNSMYHSILPKIFFPLRFPTILHLNLPKFTLRWIQNKFHCHGMFPWTWIQLSQTWSKCNQWMCCVNSSTYTPLYTEHTYSEVLSPYFLLHTYTSHHHHHYHVIRKFILWFQTLLYIHFLQQTPAHFQTSFHFNHLFTHTKGESLLEKPIGR